MTEKKISANAYQALREALPVVFHYKRPFETFLRSALRDHPDLLAGVNFGDLKPYVADEVVQRLARGEARYQQTTIDLMVAVAGMERFPDLERHEDAEYKLAEAGRAVEELRRWTEPYVRDQSEQQEAAARREVACSKQRRSAGSRTICEPWRQSSSPCMPKSHLRIGAARSSAS
ncbi:MAG TPA: hypothetical protein VGS09_01765 [Actinomycetota bacterium]|jgi:hypothetical protein|nr:hypothetical protein [Actinomycetota bacterium]